MARTLRFTNAALSDIREARAWLTQPGSGARARRRLDHLLRAVQDLRRAPCRWPVGDRTGTRERFVEGYCVVYQVNPDTGLDRTAGNVEVIRILGAGQDRSRP